MALNRRQMLLASGAALLGPAALNRVLAGSTTAPKKVLFFTKSQTFQHGPITRHDGKLGLAEQLLTDLGKEHGFEVLATKDGSVFEPDKVGQWDAFVFYTTGDLTSTAKNNYENAPPISPAGKKAFLDAIRGGKGFMGMHSATDTFHSKDKQNPPNVFNSPSADLDPYIAMIGGEFIVHGSQQKVKLDITDAKFPSASGFGSTSFDLNDEWYALRNMPDDLHVIMSYDTSSFPRKSGGDHCYDRPNFPMTWARLHGKGRVFYTAMGHREDVWENPKYQGLLLGALSWITGQVETDVTPNVARVTPDYKTLPK